jgi:hypothetical protein
VRINFQGILVLLSVAALSASAQTPAWREINHGLVNTTGNPNGPFPSNLNGLAYGNGVYVTSARGLADFGTLATSVDGINWTPRPMPLAESSGPVQFFKGKFFIQSYTSSTGTTHWSTDGINWQQVRSALEYGGDAYAANGETILGFANNYIGVSNDGITWLPSILMQRGPYTIASDGTRFIGSNGLTYSSTDGLNWTRLGGAPTFVKGIHFNGSVWLVFPADTGTSVVYTSTDNGTTFRQSSSPSPDRQHGTWTANGRFFQFANGRMHASRDGLTWSEFGDMPPGLAISVIQNIVFVNSRYYALGSKVGSPLRALMLAMDAEAADILPTIAAHPTALTVSEGTAAVFAVKASGATSYQWRRNGVELPGQTSATLVLTNLSSDHAGTYNVRARGPGGDANSNGARLVVEAVDAVYRGRIINLSVLTELTPAEGGMTIGFVVGGADTAGTKPILVRAVGPSLIPFGVTAPHGDPILELYQAGQRLSQNDDWDGNTDLIDMSAAVGAFPFASATSRDAALFVPALARGDNSARVTSGRVVGGTVLTEVYDATHAANFFGATPRLINVSASKTIAAGGSLSAGFALGGETPATVLIRVIGPGLAPFGVTSAMSDPQLALFRQGAPAALAANDDWSDDRALSDTMARVGAFALPAGSKDAALLITLPRGAYSVVASGTRGASGQALVEVYEVR